MTVVYQTILDRLFAKYRNSPNILGVLEIISDPMQDTRDVLDWILGQLSLASAEGQILEFFGELIGVDRPPAQEPNVFRMCTDEGYLDDPTNKHGLAPDDLSEGGYLTGDRGIIDQDTPGLYMGDTDYRALIYAKAALFRKKATRENVFTHLLTLGQRFKINESPRSVEYEPTRYDDLNYFVRSYIETRGFKPGGIQIKIKTQTQPDPEI